MRSLDFEVSERINLSQREMKQAIDKFGESISENHIALFYYSGHGLQIDGKIILVPHYARIDTEQDVEM